MTRTRLRRFGPLAVAAMTGVTIPIVMATPAQAHDSTTYSGHGADRGNVYNGHRSIQACNYTNDSVATTVYYRTNTGGDTVYSLTDSTYNPNLCATRTLGTGVRVTSYKVCSGDISCSAWRAA